MQRFKKLTVRFKAVEQHGLHALTGYRPARNGIDILGPVERLLPFFLHGNRLEIACYEEMFPDELSRKGFGLDFSPQSGRLSLMSKIGPVDGIAIGIDCEIPPI